MNERWKLQAIADLANECGFNWGVVREMMKEASISTGKIVTLTLDDGKQSHMERDRKDFTLFEQDRKYVVGTWQDWCDYVTFREKIGAR